MKIALAAAILAVATTASARTTDPTSERGPGILPPLAVSEHSAGERVARSPWLGSQGHFRNTELRDVLPTLKLASSNALRPRGGGSALLYFY